MDIQELRSLVLLAETGSLLKTAELSNLTAGAIHHHLKNLAAEFGLPLYMQEGGRLVLTEIGRLLLPYARQMLAQRDAAVAAVRDWREGGTGTVRVGAGPSFSSHLLPSLIKRYRRHHSRVDVFVETGTSDLVHRLRNGSLDLIFHSPSETLEGNDLEVVASWKAEAGFVGKSHIHPARCSLRQLRRYPFILYERGRGPEQLIDRYLAKLEIHPKVVMRSDSAETIKAGIRSGMGISVLFLWNITADARRRNYTVIRTEAPYMIAHMGLIKLRSSYTPRAVQEFINLARQRSWQHLELIEAGNGPVVSARRSSGHSEIKARA